MRRPLAIYLAGLVGAAVIGLLATSLWIPIDPAIGIQVDGDPTKISWLDLFAGLPFWTIVTLVASSLPVRVSDGVQVAVSTAPMMAAAVLGGPTAAGWIALVGTTESREVRGRVAWYGTLTNHAVIALPVILGAVAIRELRGTAGVPLQELIATLAGTLVFFLLNLVLVSLVVVLRVGRSLREFLTRAETANVWANALTLAPLG